MKSEGGKTFCFLVLSILSITAGSFILPKTVLADEEIVINEILFNPSGTDDTSEWVELYNSSENEVDLNNWSLDPDGGNYFNLEGKIIKGGKFLVVSGLSGMRNEKGQISLYNSKIHNESTLVDYVQYGLWDLGSTENKTRDRALNKGIWEENKYTINSAEGKSLELKKDGDDSDTPSDWLESYAEGGTPGENNFGGKDKPEEKPKQKEYSDKIRINEIFPNPEGKDDGEFIELYNLSDKEIELEGYILKDSSKNGKYAFLPGSVIAPKSYLVIYKEKLKFALNNSDEVIYLFDPDEKEIDRINCAKSAKEGVSYNFDGKNWRWSKKLTPGKENILNNLPESKLKIEKKIYKNMLAEFKVSAKDKDDDKLKFVWDFGDGHKSYLQKTKHKYEKKGIYDASLKISDGNEDVIENFTLEVGNFPKAELKIVSVKANPKGKDTKNEVIKIKNSSKKKVDLEGWSIATGQKELYNHPISKKFVLKPGETKELTRKYAAFSLNNKGTKIELRRPDGSVAAKVKYSKKEGIEDDETYEKTENGWEWVASQNDTEEKPKDTEVGQIEENKTIVEENNLISQENEQGNVEMNNEIQDDEPAIPEDEVVLGAETVNDSADYADNNRNSGNFFQRIFWSANQKINSFINVVSNYL